MITEQVQSRQEERGKKIRPQKPAITHAGIEKGDNLRIAREAGSKKDNSDQGKNRPQQSVDIRDKVEVVIKQNFLFCDRLVNKLFDVFTEVDRDRDDREKQGSEEKGTQVFTDDISVERKQDYTWFGVANIGNKRLQAPTYDERGSFHTI